MQPVPEKGKIYHFFDDGKIRPSNHYYVTIDEVYPFDEAPQEIREWAISDRQEIHALKLYAETSDYIVKGHFTDDPNEIQWFVRMRGGGWFSLDSWYCGELDVDGSIFKWACGIYGLTEKEFLGEDDG